MKTNQLTAKNHQDLIQDQNPCVFPKQLTKNIIDLPK